MAAVAATQPLSPAHCSRGRGRACWTFLRFLGCWFRWDMGANSHLAQRREFKPTASISVLLGDGPARMQIQAEKSRALPGGCPLRRVLPPSQKEGGFPTSGVCATSATRFAFLGSHGRERPQASLEATREPGQGCGCGKAFTLICVGSSLATWPLNSLGQK